MTDAEIISTVCKQFGLDGHIKEIRTKSDAYTYAERLAIIYKEPRQTMYVKNSYMYCDTLDCTFFIHQNRAYFSMSGIWFYGLPDLDGNKLESTISLAKRVVEQIQKLIEERKQSEQNESI